ncbi:MAG: carboxypeptidase-like regulatory domain-containing protein, partial [Bacteroidales bacterium]|nr:carboxypeptidase-like regulatory domain-containing protein [Bacteroidales bacterium]
MISNQEIFRLLDDKKFVSSYEIMNKLIFITFFISLFTSINLFAQDNAKIFGCVYDLNTKEPVSNVEIIIEPEKKGTLTDLKGYYHFEGLNQGKYTIIFSHIGYVKYQKKINLKSD